MNKLYFGDNLEILRELDDARVHLICTDPPFNSGRDYNAFIGDSLAQKKAFTDTWTWDTAAQDARADIEHRAYTSDAYKALNNCLKGYDLVLQNAVSGNSGAMRAYLAFMGPRLAEMHRVLTPTGSIYLHCDPTASHYLKGIMDAVFGVDNFRNEIIWQRTKAHNDGKQYGRVHDTILFYSKNSKQTVWNPIYMEHDPEYVKRAYRHQDERGPYQIASLNAPGIRQGESGQPWREINPSEVGRHWSTPRREAWPEDIQPPENYESLSVHQRLDILDAKGLVYWPPKGNVPRFKRYLSTSKGSRVHDVMTDINHIASTSKERLGYPTQKPLALYERLITASSNEGDIVLDPFCGCGTTIDAAHTLKRQWMGIDITILALDPMRQRLADRHGLEPSIDYQIEGYPTNMQEVRKLLKDGDKRKYHDFSNWAVTRLGLNPTKDVGDGGLDGVGHVTLWNPQQMKETNARILAEVKTGKPTITQVRAFCHVMDQHNAEVGIFITIEPISARMRQEAENMGSFEHNQKNYPRLQFWQLDDAYFENPDSINTLVRLPDAWRIRPTQKSERHFDNRQMQLLRG